MQMKMRKGEKYYGLVGGASQDKTRQRGGAIDEGTVRFRTESDGYCPNSKKKMPILEFVGLQEIPSVARADIARSHGRK